MSINFPSADFTPTLSGYTGQGPFRFWCQKVLPIVYDDSLSYYELLNRVVHYLNNVIKDMQAAGENIDQILVAFNELQEYVNNYLDIQAAVNKKLDQMAEDGTLTTAFGPLVAREVRQWLDDNPWATTSVVDHSLKVEKLVVGTLGYYTPEMFGAVGDGVTDDTEAFEQLANYSPVLIPNKTYSLSRSVVLNGNVTDSGEYTNYEPFYYRKLNFILNGIEWSNEILLPYIDSYVENGCYLNGKYYFACREYSSNYDNYVAVYDSDFNYIRSVALDPLYGRPNSCFTDGRYIYVEFDVGSGETEDAPIHVRYNENVFEGTPVGKNTIRNYGYWNKTYWGVGFRASSVAGNQIVDVYKVDSDFENEEIVFSFERSTEVGQSNSFYAGKLFIATTNGFMYCVDLSTHVIDKCDYNSAHEIEGFFYDGDIRICGHIYGADGVFQMGKLGGNMSYPIVEYIPVNGAEGRAKELIGTERPGVYSVTNGLSAGYPLDRFDALAFDRFGIMGDFEANAIYLKRNLGSWVKHAGYYRRNVSPENYPKIAVNLAIDLRLYIRFNNVQITGNYTRIPVDLSALFADANPPQTGSLEVSFSAVDYDGVNLGSNSYICVASVSASAITIRVINTDKSNTVNARLNGAYALM